MEVALHKKYEQHVGQDERLVESRVVLLALVTSLGHLYT